MKIRLIKIPRKTNIVVMGVLFQFLFSNALLAKGVGVDSPSLATEKKPVAQQIIVSGTITSSEDKLPVPGVTVAVKGNPKLVVVTDFDGNYKISLPSSDAVLVFSSIGFKTIEKKVGSQTIINIVMSSDQTNLEEVVVVGFGTQKKASVIGAISQTTGKVLQRTGGVSSLGAALTGNLPGISTLQTTGKPGEEDPQIIIRGVSSWNNSSPLILVDGIEREISSVDITSVETVSVLKDASATAVYGVRGANGVILITTKRGVEGKAKIDFGFNSVMKTASKLPGKYDAYDALLIKNRVIEYELNQRPDSWAYIRPQSFIDNYRNQTTQEQRERYPNIDWQDFMFKDFAMTHNANLNITGGTDKVKYFAAVDYLHEGDLVDLIPNGKGFDSGYALNRLNSRANLDFQLSKTTTLKVNLAGSYSQKQQPWRVISEGYLWQGAYTLPPDVYYPKYSDGAWGYHPLNQVQGANSAMNLTMGGAEYITTTRITSDFNLKQDLGKFIKGLSANVTFSLDNTFLENQRGANNQNFTVYEKWIDPLTGIPVLRNAPDGLTGFDFYESSDWTINGGLMDNGQTRRNLTYQAQLFYGRQFGDHNVTAMGNLQRQELAHIAVLGDLPSYREDWIFRATYDYKSKYFAEYSGAYNGTEKFASANRFGFFNSGTVGWVISKEKFMSKLTFLDNLKVRASYGTIGDDSANARFLYFDQYGNGITRPRLTTTEGETSSAYGWFTQTSIGNPNIGWENVTKKNFGVEFSIFDKLFSGSVDIFNDYRTDILMAGSDRAMPSYFGFTPPRVNLGAMEVNGYEFELHFSKRINNDVRLWADFALTHAKDRVIFRDDPGLLPDYMKREGYALRQGRYMIDQGFYNTWDELYGSPAFETNDSKIPGNYRIMDYNGDGIINQDTDRVRYGYPSNPQNTYNATLGVDWKGFSAMVQFYGVNNVMRSVPISTFSLAYFNNVFEEGTYWSKDNTNADSPVPRLNNTLNGDSWGTRYVYDGSYIRLKNAEIAYNFTSNWVKSIGLESLRVYANGNNLFLWTKTPDDREVDNGGIAYPTVRRVNLGFRLTL